MEFPATGTKRGLTVDVALVPLFLPQQPDERANTVYVVVDVIRATTTLCVLFEHGCRRVLVAPGIEAARHAHRDGGADLLLAGEVGGLAPAGFDFGNSPRELVAADLAGRELIFATTNGTQALRACMGGRAIYAGAFRNAEAVTARALRVALARDAGSATPRELPRNIGHSGASEADLGAAAPDIVIVCSGRDAIPAYDDTTCAGYLIERLIAHAAARDIDITLREGARIARSCASAALAANSVRKALSVADAARAVERVGLEDDLHWCADVDASTVVPVVTGTQRPHDLIVVETEKTTGPR